MSAPLTLTTVTRLAPTLRVVSTVTATLVINWPQMEELVWILMNVHSAMVAVISSAQTHLAHSIAAARLALICRVMAPLALVSSHKSTALFLLKYRVLYCKYPHVQLSTNVMRVYMTATKSVSMMEPPSHAAAVWGIC